MNHNSYPSSNETENNTCDPWQEAMQDVEFQKKPIGKVEKLFSKIQSIKDHIKKKLGPSSNEKITEMTDDALVYIAEETILSADKDGVRTKAEDADIEEAVSSVVLQGALEESGLVQSSGSNPILELAKGDAQSDLMTTIKTLEEEGATLQSGESIAGLATRTIEQAKKWDLTKVSKQLGSNEGGWYENPNGERFYVKFYENPSQGRAEFIANAIYEKLGIKAVRSEIIQLDGREAIASPAVPGATSADAEAQKSSQEVQEGFVADAFLANWDVVGLVYDNIVQSEDGFYRIDNGGSLIFRAQGGDKAYSPDSIPELQSMRIPGRPTGKVFAGITEQEIGRQARELIKKLTPNDIRTIVDESGIDGEDRDRILSGLLGRREFLARTYGEPEEEHFMNPESRERRPRRSVSETIRLLNNQEIELTSETAARPKTEIVCDHGHIEGQKIDVINKRDRGITEFRFKLRSPTETILAMTANPENADDDNQSGRTTPSGAILQRGKITYEGTSSSNYCDLCDASVFEKNGIRVFIANPASRENGYISSTNNHSKLIRTAMGLIKVEIPIGTAPEVTEQTLGEILEKDLGIPDALKEVPEEAEKEYKIARYRWQHVIAGELTPEQLAQAERLDREEVFPGYTTLIERDKHQEYLDKYGKDIRAIHHLHNGNSDSIYRILTQGLMSTTERYSRGILKNGMSSVTDMDTGGADSVFTRIATESQRKTMYGTIVIFKPEIFDRTDWYSYSNDTYGSTDDALFSSRLSPDAIFGQIVNPNGFYPANNEQMFRTGIGADFIESIEVDAGYRDECITKLKSMGLEEIGGRSIEEIIVAREIPIQQTPEDWNKKYEQEKIEKQTKIQAIINGESPYTSIDEIIDLANASDDFNASFKSMVESVIANGNKEKVATDMAEHLKKELSLDELQSLASGKDIDGLTDEDKEIFLYTQTALGIDYATMYKEVLASPPQKQESTLMAPWHENDTLDLWGEDEDFSITSFPPEPPNTPF